MTRMMQRERKAMDKKRMKTMMKNSRQCQRSSTRMTALLSRTWMISPSMMTQMSSYSKDTMTLIFPRLTSHLRSERKRGGKKRQNSRDKGTSRGILEERQVNKRQKKNMRRLFKSSRSRNKLTQHKKMLKMKKTCRSMMPNYKKWNLLLTSMVVTVMIRSL